ncbi:MAG: hypothetical protein ACE5OR_11860 [bacterium]
MPLNPAFGRFFKKKRMESGLTLRAFCRQHEFDPGNMSKLERCLLPPPQTNEIKEQYAKALGTKKGTDDWFTFFDSAAACSGRLPQDIADDDELLRALPLIFRTARTAKMDENTLRRFIEAIRQQLR